MFCSNRFPLANYLPSTASADSLKPLFGGFLGVGSEVAPPGLTTVRRSNWTYSFPVSSFHKGTLRALRYGRYQSHKVYQSHFTVKLGLRQLFPSVFRQRLKRNDRMRRIIQRSKRLKSLRTWALQ